MRKLLGNSDEQSRFGILVWTVLFLSAAYQVICAFQTPQFLLQHALVLDDAFYYFQVARNAADLGWVTFDGIHATSGIQMLWEGFLYLLALFFSGKMEFLQAILVLCVLFNTLAGVLLNHLGRSLYSKEGGYVAVLIWSGYMVRLSPTLMGMEYSLHVVIILCTISVWWKLWTNPHSVSSKQMVILGVLLTLNFWTRLDSAVYSVLIFLTVSIVLYRSLPDRKDLWKRMVLLALLPAVGAVGYVILCRSLAGTFIPISGLVKHHYASHFFDGYTWADSFPKCMDWYWRIQARTLLNNLIPISFAGTEFGSRHWCLLLITIIAVFFAAKSIYSGRIRNPIPYRAGTFLLLLLIFGLLHVALVVKTIGNFSYVTNHYYGWLFITWCLGAAITIPYVLSLIRPAPVRRSLAFVLLLAFFVPHIWLIVLRTRAPYRPNLNNRRWEAAAWINSNLPPTARIGAWNAGVLAYFTDRTIVNLDGLTNNREYLDFLKTKQPVETYLRKEGIEYISDVDMRDLTSPFRRDWDHSVLFRDSILWEDVEVVREDQGTPPLVLLRLKNSEQ